MKLKQVRGYEFVEFIPNELEEGFLYVSLKYATVTHNCFCGCGNEVVTPLSPTDWSLTYDGNDISLYPSIGSWGLSCQSHYWVKKGKIKWAKKWTDGEIQFVRDNDKKFKADYFSNLKESETEVILEIVENISDKPKDSFWKKLWRRMKFH